MKKIILIISIIAFCPFLQAQNPPAFPGAEGFGANATGGRGGKVIYVTNLNPNGPGSLAEALETPGKRYILFKVSGLIDAAAEVVYGDFTLAGQTSPGGIIVRGFVIDEVYDTIGTGNNMIIRHIRSRPQDPANVPSANYILDDAFRFDGASNTIIDHCSFANAIDECVQVSQSSKITIQNCMLSETLGEHFYLGGMLMNYSTPGHPQDSISIHHNTWNRIGGRMPEMSCESPYGSKRPLNLELSNNLLWDQQINIWYESNINPSLLIDSFFINLNWVNNYCVGRSSYSNGMIAHNLLDIAGNKIYASGNKMNLYPSYSDYDLFYCCNDFDQAGNNPNTDLGIAKLLPARHPFPTISYTASNTLVNYMQQNVGAFPRDSMDRRLTNPFASGIPLSAPIDQNDYFKDAFIVDFNPFNPPVPLIDSDFDGMPDYWEVSRGLNPAVQDHNGTNLSLSTTGIAGYTNLECYLNCLSDYLVSGQTTPVCGIIGTTYVQDLSTNENLVSVFPNPSTGHFQLTINNLQKGKIIIYNTLGEVVHQQIITSANQKIDLTQKLKGVYFYQLQVEGKILKTGKIIIE